MMIMIWCFKYDLSLDENVHFHWTCSNAGKVNIKIVFVTWNKKSTIVIIFVYNC